MTLAASFGRVRCIRHGALCALKLGTEYGMARKRTLARSSVRGERNERSRAHTLFEQCEHLGDALAMPKTSTLTTEQREAMQRAADAKAAKAEADKAAKAAKAEADAIARQQAENVKAAKAQAAEAAKAAKAAKAAEAQTAIARFVAENKPVLSVGARDVLSRMARYDEARRFWQQPDAMQRLGLIVTQDNDTVFASCVNQRYAEANNIAMQLLAACERGMALEQLGEQGSADYGALKTDVLALVALLVQRMPSSVAGNEAHTLMLTAHKRLYSGMRGVELDIQHTAPADKLAEIRAANDKRAQRAYDRANGIRAMLGPVVIDAN